MEYGDIIPNEDGTVGQVLTSNGPGTQPTFQAAGGGDPNFIGFFANVNTTTSLPDNTQVVLPANNEIYDVGGYYDNTTYRFTPLVEGYYYVYGSAYMDDDGSRIVNARVMCYARHNGSLTQGRGVKKFGATQVNMDITTEYAGVFYMDGATDYLDMILYANSFGAQTQTANAWYTTFGASLINAV